ncbi:MAG: hypothetical protein HQL93_08645 [Magnetococcales bacterium]|nr:hypothetical protein [Magnetococcales bacterium]
MNIWNLLEVLCFMALYLAISLVFIQVQKLREELKTTREEPDVEPMDPAVYAATLRREMAAMEGRLEKALHTLSEQMQPELKGIHDEIRYMVRPGNNMNTSHHTNMADNSSPSSMSDAYREARLLLANGVDEERVVNETGLTVEEVSLLKRIHQNQPE